MRQLVLEGVPYAMGLAHGRAMRDEVHALAEERLRLSLRDARLQGVRASREEALALAREMLPLQERWSTEVHAEFMGIADGAGIAPELLLIGNGYTDFRDVLARARTNDQRPTTNDGTEQGDHADRDRERSLVVGRWSASEAGAECTVFRVGPEASVDGRVYIGQTWDMHSTAEPFVLSILRRPAEGPATLGVTTAGCLSLVGVNACGLGCGNSNLTPTDARPGVIYLAMIHAALASETWEAACAAIRDAPRASGHNYYLSGPGAAFADIETTAEEAAMLFAKEPIFVHANHYQSSRLLPLQAPLDATATTRHRERRLRARLEARKGSLDPETIRQCLADHDDGPGPVCVHDHGEGGKSCAAVVLCPETREIWWRIGTPCGGPLTNEKLE
jgi:isopenicillin-N N-acyltransferase-like protein